MAHPLDVLRQLRERQRQDATQRWSERKAGASKAATREEQLNRALVREQRSNDEVHDSAIADSRLSAKDLQQLSSFAAGARARLHTLGQALQEAAQQTAEAERLEKDARRTAAGALAKERSVSLHLQRLEQLRQREAEKILEEEIQDHANARREFG